MRNGESIYRPCPSNFYFSTGTDEHGKKIQDSANVQGFSTENYCTVYSNKFMNLFKKFDISFTEYIRTTSPNHIEAVQYFWNVLDKGGYIFKRSYEGWYSIVDECFYNDYEVTDYTSNDGKQTKIAIETKSFVTKISEENYAFDMSNFYEQIRQWAHKPGSNLNF